MNLQADTYLHGWRNDERTQDHRGSRPLHFLRTSHADRRPGRPGWNGQEAASPRRSNELSLRVLRDAASSLEARAEGCSRVPQVRETGSRSTERGQARHMLPLHLGNGWQADAPSPGLSRLQRTGPTPQEVLRKVPREAPSRGKTGRGAQAKGCRGQLSDFRCCKSLWDKGSKRVFSATGPLLWIRSKLSTRGLREPFSRGTFQEDLNDE